jgi:hypothetical protein
MNRNQPRGSIRSSQRTIRRDRIDTCEDRVTLREPIGGVLGSGMPACGYRMTTWSEVFAL